ncbi:hypothetical protein N7539_009279 [Penicillium diatomitis]|uniref:Transcriptional regulator n=1 Tax=Penicillium diatomitis TaxID=2819901 RepID=A0A9W9WLJ3_9EURO|nr:uncharacterized protein N7539_009279 [Penicillium diatomitis]KAJ5469661.1 hypothetical protein N7539_009279 [Penicillium diatomitis]
MVPKYTVSDSDDSAQNKSAPSDKELDQALRAEVGQKYNEKNYEELTVKRVRRAVEEQLGLEQGYFKNTGDWKTRSEEIIKDEFEILRTSAPNGDEESQQTSNDTERDSLHAASPKTKRQQPNTVPEPRKRQKLPARTSRKHNKPSPDESEDEVTEKATTRVTPVKQPPSVTRKKPSPKQLDQAQTEEENEDSNKMAAEAPTVDSESEMSVVYDEEPKPKPARNRKSSEAPSKKPAPKKGAVKGKDEDLDPDQAEIKRLQGWLVKCGIRKMWWRELQPYETPKAKIKHLKDMLEDVGMKGRYSLDKARQIRDERELKADLEQIQQGAKQWGAEDEEGEESGGPAKPRRAARGRQALAFLDSDGEETD